MAYEEFGPLAGLIGTWRGEEGVNVFYDYAQSKIHEEPYHEEIQFKPVGEVTNGEQHLFVLDYITSARRMGQEDVFHTELGYWSWDPARGEVARCFMVPRMSAILAGGTCAPDATSFTMRADIGSEGWGVLSNPHLLENARCTRYELNVTIEPDTFTYEENTVMEMRALGGKSMDHTDRNRLKRIA